jgi:glycosyltransferase involved in cell wall biosynthesis
MADQIRVATVVTRFIAGAGGVALRGALALDPERYSVTVLSADGGSLLARAEAAGMEVVRLRHMRPELNPIEDWRALAELTRELRRRNFDVVHTHSSKAGALGRLAARRAGVPAVVHTFHGFPFNQFQSALRRQAYIAIERRLGRMTDAFLAVGGAVAAEAIRLRIAPPERTLVIASAIETDIVPVTPASRREARRLLGMPPHARIVGTVGRLDAQKAPEDMLAAFALLRRPDTYFVWIGDGPHANRVGRAIRRRGLSERFILLGERRDVPALLPGLDVFAMSSRYEGLPCALVEAMTCGVPAVATTVNAVPEAVVNGRTGLLVPPAQPAYLARAIAHMLDHPEAASRMALAAQAALGDAFQPQRLGRDLAETYQSALQASRVVIEAEPLREVSSA